MPDQTQMPVRRPLHLIWIVDCSGSMKGLKLAAVNRGIRSSTASLRQAAAAAVEADIRVRAVTFGWGARWHFDQPTELRRFDWRDVAADGLSDMGAAMALTAEGMTPDLIPALALPPVCVLISDGLPTDDFGRGLQALLDQAAGARAVRAAVAVGADADTECLAMFVGGAGMPLIVAQNGLDLEAKVKWAAIHSLLFAAGDPDATLPPPPSDIAPRGAHDFFDYVRSIAR